MNVQVFNKILKHYSFANKQPQKGSLIKTEYVTLKFQFNSYLHVKML